jgi:TPR repeat protein
LDVIMPIPGVSWKKNWIKNAHSVDIHSPKSEEAWDRNLLKRVEANDPAAMRQLGGIRRNEGDYDVAVEYSKKAAELGNADAHYDLSVMYRKGNNVEKDEKKEVYHLEQAAIGGHPYARYNLGCEESRNGKYEIAMKHHIIAAKLGYDGSLGPLKKGYRGGLVSKKDLEAALRGQQAFADATKSPHREAAFAARQEAEAAKVARSN